MENIFRRIVRRFGRKLKEPLGIILVIAVGVVVLSQPSMGQDGRDSVVNQMENVIKQLNLLRDRLKVSIAPGGPRVPDKGALVRGFIAVSVGGNDDSQQKISLQQDIYLPNINVTLRNLATNTTSEPVRTDLSGRFTARVQGTDRYQICWHGAGFKAGCDNKTISVQRWFVNIGTVRIPLSRDRGHVAVYGNVTLADGSTPRALEPVQNINAFATIALLDKSGASILEVPVNNHDEYVFPLVPLGKTLQVLIRVEQYKHSQLMQLGNANVPVQNLDFTILNNPPKIDPLVALDSNQIRVSNARPGEKVKLRTRFSDPDNDKLRFKWEVSSGTLSSTTDPEPEWTLPKIQGNHAATLIAYDGKGGYDRSSVNVTIDRSGMVFSGTVSGTDAAVLPGAQVDINGRLAVTDSRGYFRLRIPDRKRFVMTIRKVGYAFSSNIYFDRVVGGRWQLTRANVFRIPDPSKTIDLQNKRSHRECPGAPSEQVNWRDNPTLAVPQYQDGRGNIAPLPKEAEKLPGLPSTGDRDQPSRRCGPGISVQIPGGSLVDANGNAASGPVDVQLSTVDLQSPGQMPGNYTVLMPDGSTQAMESFGAGTVEIFAGATSYNLKPGASATVTIPVDPGQLVSGKPLDPTIPLLSYDEKRGLWKRDGTAMLQSVGSGLAYVAEVSHFTAYNTDLIKNDQSCLAIENQAMPANYDLELTIPLPTGGAPVRRLISGVIGGTSETAIGNLPSDTNIVLVPIRTTDPDPNQNNLPIGVFVVNTGAPQNPAWPTVPGGFQNEPVGPPYYQETGGVPDGACSTKVVLTDLGLGFYPATPPQGAFLHGLGSFAAVNLSDLDPAFPDDANAILRAAVEQASVDYRGQIDPRGIRPTLSCFKVVNRMPLDPGETCPAHTGTGFVAQPALGETAAVYANTVDLGFGREMHCTQAGANVACYVSNYDSLVYTGPGEGTDVTKAQSAADGLNGLIPPDATVAMEFTQIEDSAANGSPITYSDPDRVVKFYVYNQLGNPVDAANLDGLGSRPVPQLCMVCHGGQIPNPNLDLTTSDGVPTAVFASRDDVKLDAKFLPFDLRSFTFAAPDTDAANPYNKANQQTQFQQLNQMVKVAPPPDPFDATSNVISDLYDAWYPGDATPQLENEVVPLWKTDALHEDVYDIVVARACRTCHVANASPTLRFEQPGASAGVSFDGNLGSIQQRVCRQHVMPHARRTHDLFWTSVADSQPATLQTYGDAINSFGWQDIANPGVDPSLVCGQEFTQGGGPPIPPSAFTPVATVLSICVGCHNAANAASESMFNVAGLNLEGGVGGVDAYGRIVNVNATELPSMNRVALGASTENTSYLWHKINGSHEGLGGYSPPGPGDPMPCCATPLSTSDPAAANTVRDWIISGALP